MINIDTEFPRPPRTAAFAAQPYQESTQQPTAPARMRTQLPLIKQDGTVRRAAAKSS